MASPRDPPDEPERPSAGARVGTPRAAGPARGDERPAAAAEIATARPEIFGRFVVFGVVDDGMPKDDADNAGPAATVAPTTHIAVDLERELRPIVALQRLPASLSLPRKERVAFEGAFAWHERITDEHVAGYVGHGELDGVMWRAREWVEGVCLDDFIERCGAASAPEPEPELEPAPAP
jgi:hypothetical protein